MRPFFTLLRPVLSLYWSLCHICLQYYFIFSFICYSMVFRIYFLYLFFLVPNRLILPFLQLVFYLSVCSGSPLFLLPHEASQQHGLHGVARHPAVWHCKDCKTPVTPRSQVDKKQWNGSKCTRSRPLTSLFTAL